MPKYEVTDHQTTYTVEAADRERAILAYAEMTGLNPGVDFRDADDLAQINDLFVEEVSHAESQ